MKLGCKRNKLFNKKQSRKETKEQTRQDYSHKLQNKST